MRKWILAAAIAGAVVWCGLRGGAAMAQSAGKAAPKAARAAGGGELGPAQPATGPTTQASQPTTRPAKSLTEEWLDVLAKGGKTMVFLALLSVTAVTYGLERLFRLRRGAIVPEGLSASANKLWAQGRYDEIIALADKHPSTLGRILQFIVRHRANPVADVSATAGDMAAVELRYHTRRCYPLAVVATLSPLLGLLGTVFGMIESFDVVAIAGALGDASQLAGGISKALITTAAGLCIAVPALAAYHYFRERTNLYGDILEKEVTDLVIEWLMRKERQP